MPGRFGFTKGRKERKTYKNTRKIVEFLNPIG
jgi:hypothetical protein